MVDALLVRNNVKAASFADKISELNLADRVDQRWVPEREVFHVIQDGVREPPVFVEVIAEKLVFEGLLSLQLTIVVELFDIALFEHMVRGIVKRCVAHAVEKTGLKGQNDAASDEFKGVQQTEQQI